jgi:hypothetical protein
MYKAIVNFFSLGWGAVFKYFKIAFFLFAVCAVSYLYVSREAGFISRDEKISALNAQIESYIQMTKSAHESAINAQVEAKSLIDKTNRYYQEREKNIKMEMQNVKANIQNKNETCDISFAFMRSHL